MPLSATWRDATKTPAYQVLDREGNDCRNKRASPSNVGAMKGVVGAMVLMRSSFQYSFDSISKQTSSF